VASLDASQALAGSRVVIGFLFHSWSES
jgi:hypothetical protein